jgi:predicted ArsR family transcriptional regulator
MSQDDERSPERILFDLKTRGAQTAAAIAARLDMTPAGARQHLLKLEADNLVESYDLAQGRGRPRKHWQLSPRGHQRFPDRHSDLTLDLLQSVRSVFGEPGLERLIEHRERASLATYRDALGEGAPLKRRLLALAEIRSQEGYMASVIDEGQGCFLLIENHCPICAAATACQGLCRSELAIFRAVMGADASVERIEHIPMGARRCAYRVRSASSQG